MNKVNTLPNEILSAIFEKLPNKEQHKCLFVCKYWFTTMQTILYKEISIDIGFTDNIFDNSMFDTLVNSVFAPGRWVKKITVKRLKVPDNLMRLDRDTDPLHLLITHCPRVDEFCFQRTNFIFESEWIYFQTVLEQRTNGWKLRNIAEHFDKEDYQRYYDCAYIMRDSLTEFHLKKKVDDYVGHFKDFKKLSDLFISRHVINDIVECDKILDTLPSLVGLDVDFHVPKSHEAGRKKRELASQHNNKIFDRLKKLHLNNFPISRDLDLLFIMNKFTGLAYAKLKVAKSKPWPISKMSLGVIQGFFGFVCNIPVHSVLFRDIDMVAMMDIYYSRTKDFKHAFDLSFTNILDEGENAINLEVTNDDGQKEKIKLAYNLGGSSVKERMEKARKTLVGISHHINEIYVSLMGKHEIAKQINEFMPIVFDSCKDLDKVTFFGGVLSHNMTRKKIRPDAITQLVFEKSHIDPKAIALLLNSFLYLKSFELNNCTFMNNQWIENAVIINMDMFHTDFDSIKISLRDIGMPGVTRPANKHEFCAQAVQIVKSYLFIIINFGHDQTTKYYGGDILVGGIEKAKREAYYQYLDECGETNQNQLNVYCLNVKSLQHLYFITPKRNIVLQLSNQ